MPQESPPPPSSSPQTPSARRIKNKYCTNGAVWGRERNGCSARSGSGFQTALFTAPWQLLLLLVVDHQAAWLRTRGGPLAADGPAWFTPALLQFQLIADALPGGVEVPDDGLVLQGTSLRGFPSAGATLRTPSVRLAVGGSPTAHFGDPPRAPTALLTHYFQARRSTVFGRRIGSLGHGKHATATAVERLRRAPCQTCWPPRGNRRDFQRAGFTPSPCTACLPANLPAADIRQDGGAQFW